MKSFRGIVHLLYKIKHQVQINHSTRPLVIGIGLVYLATLLLQHNFVYSKEHIAGFTIVMFLFSMLFIFKDVIFRDKHLLYFIVQGTIVFDFAVIMNSGFQLTFLGLLPILIAQSVEVYRGGRQVFFISTAYYGVFSFIIWHLEGSETLISYLPILIFGTLAVWIYNRMFCEQVELRVRTQGYAMEIERTQTELEELAALRERERVARDLHDTLSQGLAGIALQLEAQRLHFEAEQFEKAKAIGIQSLNETRRALKESREVLAGLRYDINEHTVVEPMIQRELQAFSKVSGLTIEDDFSKSLEVDTKTAREITLIARELLHNVLKHASASHIKIAIHEVESGWTLIVEDDGIGFDVRRARLKWGHYGLRGIEERCKYIDATLSIVSTPKVGTRIEVTKKLQAEA